jgi:hypothetical protein
MSKTLPAVALLLWSPLNAQFMENPDFDSGGYAGWQGSCWDLGPGYGGGNSLEFLAGISWECCVYTPITGLMQDVPYDFSFWARKTGDYIFGMVFIMGFPPADSTCPFTQEPQGGTLVPLSLLFNQEWTHLSNQFILPSSLPPDLNYYVVLSPSNYQDNGFGTILFDEFAINDLSTGLPEQPSAAPNAAPNPATDKLRVDLPDIPLSITAIDATGRTHALQNFQYTNRTLEVDVSTLPSGVTVLRIATSSGNHTVRFIKSPT